MPLVTVIVPVYNAAAFVAETLDSIRAQTFDDIEIICVDDASADGSANIIEAYGGGVRLIRRLQNSGLASAPRNDGLRAASAELIALCDADDLMLPGKLAAQVQCLRDHPEIDFCFTDFVDFDDNGDRPPHLSTCTAFLSSLGPRTPGYCHVLAPQTAVRTLINENFVGASTMVFRRSLVESIGMFREDLRGSEDIDFVMRATARGPVGFLDMIGHRRRLHDANVSRNAKRMLMSESRVLQDRYGITRDAVERRLLRARISRVYESLAYILRCERSGRSSLHMALLAARWDVSRISAYREIAKAAVAPWLRG